MTAGHKILIIDDDRAVCSSLQLLLTRNQYLTKSIFHPSLIEETLEDFIPNLIILDMNFAVDTSGKQGLKALELILKFRPKSNVILITGWATVQLAVEGMKLGARDFIAKPWDNKHLLQSVETILALADERKDNNKILNYKSNIIGNNKDLKEVLDIASRVAVTNASVLITGESGTGKELLAEMIHALSPRHQQPFVKVNLGGISQPLFESEMFGHKKGAFTDAYSDRMGRFALANHGTIFLDEIGDLHPSSQVKLLRVLQEKKYEVLGSSQSLSTDVRIISATNQNLKEMTRLGTFREDLFYRINLIHLHIPTLNERREDIPVLVEAFTEKIGISYGFSQIEITDKAKSWLMMQDYVGNIRQLKNVVERTILLNIGLETLDVKHFETHFNTESHSNLSIYLPEVGTVTLENLEIEMIKKALQFHNFSISQTARSLGITRSALYRRLEKYNIPHEREI